MTGRSLPPTRSWISLSFGASLATITRCSPGEVGVGFDIPSSAVPSSGGLSGSAAAVRLYSLSSSSGSLSRLRGKPKGILVSERCR